ncbi:MAG: cyclase family protein [Paenibacillaceae bacterium]
MLRMYDITMTIHPGMQVWNNDESKKPILRNESTLETATAYESRIDMNAHTGTHIDAPLHMVEGGAPIESIALERLVGPARVLDLTDVVGSIGREHLKPFGIQRNEWLLFKTKNSFSEQFDLQFVFLNADGAAYLRDIGINGVATDGLGIERDQPGCPTHHTFFAADILIVEGIRLKDVPAGNYTFILAPLKLEGIEAAPARAFLMGQ